MGFLYFEDEPPADDGTFGVLGRGGGGCVVAGLLLPPEPFEVAGGVVSDVVAFRTGLDDFGTLLGLEAAALMDSINFFWNVSTGGGNEAEAVAVVVVLGAVVTGSTWIAGVPDKLPPGGDNELIGVLGVVATVATGGDFRSVDVTASPIGISGNFTISI